MTAYDADIEAILGGKPDPHEALRREQSERPRREKRLRQVARAQSANQRKKDEAVARGEDEPESLDSHDLVTVKNGVSVYWLAQAFKMTPENVRRRLAECPPLKRNTKGFRYDLRTAASYLIDPQIDIESYLKNMRSTDLPANLQKEIWDARLKRQKWEAQAGELWHTQDVMAVLSSTFAIIKSTVQLWPDTVERQTGLTDEQRELLIALGDSLQDEVYQGLTDAARERSTLPSLSLIEDNDDDDDLEDVL